MKVSEFVVGNRTFYIYIWADNLPEVKNVAAILEKHYLDYSYSKSKDGSYYFTIFEPEIPAKVIKEIFKLEAKND